MPCRNPMTQEQTREFTAISSLTLWAWRRPIGLAQRRNGVLLFGSSPVPSNPYPPNPWRA